jgi:cellulose biosynthesis protein BcsQ
MVKVGNGEDQESGKDILPSRFHFPETSLSSPKVIAFYSFKGGAGRTLHLASYLFALLDASKEVEKKVTILVVDADLEAPGLTYWDKAENQQLRRDFLRYSITQNLAQFESLYRAYDLSWDADSFLKLVYWVCSQASVIDANEEIIDNLSREQIIANLEQLWGKNWYEIIVMRLIQQIGSMRRSQILRADSRQEILFGFFTMLLILR